MQLPRLYFDIDGVIAFQPEGSVLAVNGRFGTSYLVAEASAYPWSATLPQEQRDWLNANEPVICANLAPDTTAIRVVGKAVKAGYQVTVITERDPSLADITAAWLAYWRIPCGSLAVVGPGGKGPLIAEQGGPALLVDDSPVNAGLAAQGIEVWQPARPYNSGGEGVHRFDDWRDVKKRLRL